MLKMLEFQVQQRFETSIIPNVSKNKIINNGPDPSIKVEIPIFKGRFNLEILFIIIILDL